MAEAMPGVALTTLAHHIDAAFLEEAYRRTRKSGSPGIDGQKGAEYGDDLQRNLEGLLSRLKTGTYHAPPGKRVYIPKVGGQRPLGLPTFEDKVLQRAVAMVLEAIYEQDFLPCSYGFRPGKSAHNALSDLRTALTQMWGGWIVDLDIENFFGTLDHKHLNAFLDQRVRDGVIRRLIGKWLNAGVFEDGAVHRNSEGTPQGGVISPILANIYLHHVLDAWFDQEVRPRMRGPVWLIRYADDAVIGCALEEDARRILEVLPKRLTRYGLKLHPEKTRLVPFKRPPRHNGGGGTPPPPSPGTFDFLGFVHLWSLSRNRNWVIKQWTSKSRFQRGLKAINQWCRKYRHIPVAVQHDALRRKLIGHYNYYGISGNGDRISRFRMAVGRTWRNWLNRRSQGNHMPWPRFMKLMERYPLPPAIAYHSAYRLAANP
jgi:group II intron reverse transcriptase/maturase